MNPVAWVENFRDPEDIHHAVHLLNVFLYFNQAMSRALTSAAVQSVSTYLSPTKGWESVTQAWRTFLAEASFVVLPAKVAHERPRYDLLKSWAEFTLDIPIHMIDFEELREARIPQDVSRLVILDDFFGRFDPEDDRWHTVAKATTFEASDIPRLVYCVLVAYGPAVEALTTFLPPLTVSSPHLLPPQYSAIASHSALWPEPLADSGPEFVARASTLAGIPSSLAFGDGDLAFALAFEHRVPAASLPLFTWSSESWSPLLSEGNPSDD